MAIVIGIGGVLGARLGYLWIGFDVVSQFGMQFILLTMAAILGMFAPRYKGLVTTILFAIMISLYALWPHWVSAGPASIAPLAQGEQQLKLASFNTFGYNKQYAKIEASIIALNADVVTLVEMEADKAVVLQNLKQTYPYQVGCVIVLYCHLAVISKYPLQYVQAEAVWTGPPYIRATLQLNNQTITIFGVHTTRFPQSRSQLAQVNALVKLLETVQGPTIVMGDFNATPFSRINQTISQGTGFSRLSYLPTWPASVGFPQLAIDHIFVSPGIRALSNQQIGDNAGSDHFPISIVVALPSP